MNDARLVGRRSDTDARLGAETLRVGTRELLDRELLDIRMKRNHPDIQQLSIRWHSERNEILKSFRTSRALRHCSLRCALVINDTRNWRSFGCVGPQLHRCGATHSHFPPTIFALNGFAGSCACFE